MISETQNNSLLTLANLNHIDTRLDRISRNEIIEYLKSSHRNYRNSSIPQIEQSFLGLLKMFPLEPSLSVIFNMFFKFQISLKLQMKIEETTIYLNEIKKNATGGNNITHAYEEPFLVEIISSLNRQTYSSNLFCQVLINQLVRLNNELEQHCWIEENLI